MQINENSQDLINNFQKQRIEDLQKSHVQQGKAYLIAWACFALLNLYFISECWGSPTCLVAGFPLLMFVSSSVVRLISKDTLNARSIFRAFSLALLASAIQHISIALEYFQRSEDDRFFANETLSRGSLLLFISLILLAENYFAELKKNKV